MQTGEADIVELIDAYFAEQPQYTPEDECLEPHLMRRAKATIEALRAEIADLREDFDTIKEYADSDETQLCWSTANDAIARIDTIIAKQGEGK